MYFHPSIVCTCLCLQGHSDWYRSLAVTEREAGHTLDRSPVHHRATQRHTGQTTIHTLTRSLERPLDPTVLFADCGRKLEYLGRTQACTGRTCKLHTERRPAGS
ncbi:hypothetical protein AMECASPLE_017657 [Ameca splendens]|uniref:Secreted protein n=1 Tax=Ameca splendens TaxID=208324 RepID=A0ABV0Y2Z4_9TELE